MKDSPTEANHVSSEDTPVEMGQAPSEDIPEVYSTETDRAHDDDVPTEPGLTNDEDSPPELIEKNSQDDDLHIEDTSTTIDRTEIVAIPAIQRKKRKLNKLYIFVAALLLACVLVSGFSFAGFQKYSKNYHGELTLAQEGMQQLRMAETLLKALPQKPFDAQSISQAQREFAAASTDFVQVDHDLSSLPGISTLVPGYGSRLSAALHVLPIAIEVSRAGIIGCNVLNLITSRFHDPLSTSAQGLTMADFSLIEKDFQQLKGLLNLVIDQISHLQPSKRYTHTQAMGRVYRKSSPCRPHTSWYWHPCKLSHRIARFDRTEARWRLYWELWFCLAFGGKVNRCQHYECVFA